METILMSACLLGDKVKYNGKDNYSSLVEDIKLKYNIVPICPEVLGGLSIPRTPVELKNGIPFNKDLKDFSKNFEVGANKVINIVKYLHIKKAILMERSPSCGVNKIYDGTFKNNLIDGKGYTTKKLESLNVECLTIDDFYNKYITNKN